MWSTLEAVNVAPLRNERRVERPVPNEGRNYLMRLSNYLMTRRAAGTSDDRDELMPKVHLRTQPAIMCNHSSCNHSACNHSACNQSHARSGPACLLQSLHAITQHAIKAMLEADLRAFSKVFDLAEHHLNRPREPNDANHQRQVIGQQRPEEAKRGPHRPAGDSTGHQRPAEDSICTYPKLLPYVSLMT